MSSFIAEHHQALIRAGLAGLASSVIAAFIFMPVYRAEQAKIEAKTPSGIARKTAEDTLKHLRATSGPDAAPAAYIPIAPRAAKTSQREQIMGEFRSALTACNFKSADANVVRFRLLYLTLAAKERGATYTPKDDKGTTDQTSKWSSRLWRMRFTSTMSHDAVITRLAEGYQTASLTNDDVRLAMDEQFAPPSKRCVGKAR